ncbi:BREX-2 system phosphatase PglZ [Cupriavidus plantarum]|uniref:PglZ domain-containing protein n=1 Tax=Cupriavidus plantarum TaxID=942865 RepID=A0A316F013_9BURK|nr:BREX-2 system phosphatase PglZ [Cupriavidus plantarum]PWK37652.1 PglZ domain-containing protein [Cupriavidus plantarum]
MSLSTPQITAQLERVLSSDATAQVVAIRAATRQVWPDSVTQHGRQFQLRWCESSLAIREALCDMEQQDPAVSGLIVLTPLSTHEIAEDIAARLSRARVFQPEGWDIVRLMFEAKETDARLGKFAWMPQALIDGASQGPYQPVANGFLDLETAWREVLARFLGIEAARPDAVALLQWSTTPDADARLRPLPAAMRTDILAWLAETAGMAGAMVLGCVEAGRTSDALPLGLVSGVVFAADGEGQAALGQAAIRLERFVNDKHVGVTEGRTWALAAGQVVRSQGLEACRPMLERADSLLRDLRIPEFAQLSDVLPSALDQRLTAFARALRAHSVEPTEANLRQVETHADRALGHALLNDQKARMERVEMARRLARWLLSPMPSGASLTDSVEWQADEGAYVDWARFRLLGGDELTELSDSYIACRQAVIARRNAFARPFADGLVQWNAQTPADTGRIVPLERVLDKVLSPIAASQPTLLLVMDGLSNSIFRELFSRVGGLGWQELVPEILGKPFVGVAAVPTITEVSRATLLFGRLTVGTQAQEKAGFAAHGGLLAHSRAEHPPKVFHKGDLSDAGSLAPEVRAALANQRQQVVAVVYNAVDDHLSGPDQLSQRWALEDLRLLLPLLREARESRRAVVITADHGHLLEDGTTQVPGGESDRWRLSKTATSPQEIAISGGRVVTGDGSNAVVCLWGESSRYAGRKNGYHGGLSPQEITVPLSVFVPSGVNLSGWAPAPPNQPEWWELPPILREPKAVPLAPPQPRATRKKPVQTEAQPGLFAPVDLPPLTPAPKGAVPDDWIGGLLSSPIYASQRQLAARVALSDEDMRRLLEALAERGGKLSQSALANRLALAEVRVRGQLSAVRRVLNVDQAAVLTVDEAAGSVDLNIALLQQQFKLPRQGEGR